MAKKTNPAAAPAPEVRAPAPERPPVGPPATFGPEIVEDVPLAAVAPCPFNVRRHFDPADLASLADSIRALGLKEPLLVRPVGRAGGPAPEWNGYSWIYLGEPAYELADGERRFRALALIHQAGGDIGMAPRPNEIPVIVRPMTDEAVRAVMLVSREQSRDLRTSELVAGYTALAVGRTVEQLAEFLGRKNEIAHVRGVLKLARLPEWALAAIDAGKLKPASAVLVAGLHSEPSRKRAAACAILGWHHPDDEVDALIADHFDRGEDPTEADDWDYDGPLTYRELKDLLASDFQRELKSAPFPRQALDLLEGVGSCDACPKRAGNDPDAVEAKVRADMCLDPECYRAKEEVWNTRVVEAAKASGKTILPKKDAEKLFNRYGDDSLAYRSGYVDLAATCYQDKEKRTYGALLKGHVADDQVAIAVGPKTGKPFELVKEDLADTVLKAKYKIGERPGTSGSNDKWLKEQRERKKKAELGRAAAAVANGLVAAQVKEKLPPGFPVFQGGVPLLQQVAATVASFGGSEVCRVVAKRRGLPLKDPHAHREAVSALAFTLAEPRDLIALVAELAATYRTMSWASEYARDNVSKEERAFFAAFGIDRKTLTQDAAAEKKAAKASKKKDKKKSAGGGVPAPAPVALTTWDGVPNFPEQAAAHLATKGVNTVADLDAVVERLKRGDGGAARPNGAANRYTALKELGVPPDVVYQAGDALVDWEGAKGAPAAAAAPKPKGKRKAGAA
ncbi:Chromosome-partitioning protein Spo0J [Gemmata obscuriglobus]|uniref:ParB-like N-terminal domain-containing protein n=1 Tax=Gemmata obscuriglobus TaxID=114 RepID=A0A2Z3H1H3_9BACT|nr:ParB N-terminal domain-containing protein [Gemmata obscuriglobus]AWM38182.1 hypothetical protein C1280_15115 [Gemmata obscuriglobus]QEG28917.1 Chromosome-partitioning protein Spo0J [Gemmata obscuriglobus]VTS07408.1 Putative ParB family protein OS=Methyloversatilis universalis (strain ATCC BAA-1314 / JCM 13912 / FAM5) GN=METUNv1_00514 PE=4 SV=1: ParBc [Gemmata obscuriglobus UQM 2246]